MKRIMAVMLVLGITLSLAGCGGQPGITAPPAGPASGAQQQEQPLPDWLAIGELAEPVQLVSADESGVNVTATGIRYEDPYLVVDLEMENTTGASALLGSVEYYGGQYLYSDPYNCAINGQALPCDVWGDAEAGQTITAAARFSLSDLRRSGITEVADIQLAFTIDTDGTVAMYHHLPIPTSLADAHDRSTDGLQAALDSGAFEAEGYTLVFDSAQGPEPELARRIVGFTGADGSALVGIEFCAPSDIEGANTYVVDRLFINNVQLFFLYNTIHLDAGQSGVLFFEVNEFVDGASLVGELARMDALVTLYTPYTDTEYLILESTETAGDLSVLGPADVGREMFNAGGVQLFLRDFRAEEDSLYLDVRAYSTDTRLDALFLEGEGATVNGAPFAETEDVWVPTDFAQGDLTARRYCYMEVELDAELLAAAGVGSPSEVTEITMPVSVLTHDMNGGQDIGAVTFQLGQ